MCDYSLHAIATRTAEVGEKLVCTRFPFTTTRGFTGESEPLVAVCLRPGTEIAFDREAEFDGLLFRKRTGERLARFRQIDTDKPHHHHDALEFASGKIVLVTDLTIGQTARVLQLPAERQDNVVLTPAVRNVVLVPV
jgi:hypothetical protein